MAAKLLMGTAVLAAIAIAVLFTIEVFLGGL